MITRANQVLIPSFACNKMHLPLMSKYKYIIGCGVISSWMGVPSVIILGAGDATLLLDARIF